MKIDEIAGWVETVCVWCSNKDPKNPYSLDPLVDFTRYSPGQPIEQDNWKVT